MRIPFACPLSEQTKSSLWRSSVCEMTFSLVPAGSAEQSCGRSHRGSGQREPQLLLLCAPAQEAGQGWGGLALFCWDSQQCC